MALLSRLSLQDWGVTLLDLVFPEPPLPGEMPHPTAEPFCEKCGERFDGVTSTAFECTNCQGRRWNFAWARAYYPARGSVREAIHGFKYQQQFHLRKHLIGWLAAGFDRHVAPSGLVWDGLVPVPLHPLRRRERGFNQALEIARGLSKRRQIPVMDCLNRLRPTDTQTKLSRDERWRNLRGAFGLRSRFDVRGKNLLLIDDVFTTGATCEGCAQVLHQAGAVSIGVLTVARG